jgi:hypothetical protein
MLQQKMGMVFRLCLAKGFRVQWEEMVQMERTVQLVLEKRRQCLMMVLKFRLLSRGPIPAALLVLRPKQLAKKEHQ